MDKLQNDPQSSCKPKVYRIPALLSVDETLLTFAERRTEKADHMAEELAMKKGALQRETNRVTVEWTEQKIVEEAHIDGYRTMNPCPVYDRTNGKLFLFFICVEGNCTEWWQIGNYCNKTRLCYVTSDDLGETWSGLTDLTEHLHSDWVTFAIGPGHGLQTESGRLMIPAYAYVGVSPAKPIPHAVSLYSDDSGVNWQFGTLFDRQSIECQMAEVCDANGRYIYCNARSSEGHRVEASSDSKGQIFAIHSDKKLVETGCGCQGSVVSFPAQNKDSAAAAGDATHWLLYTHPSHKRKRLDLGVFLNKSPSDPNAWSEPWILYRGPSGYSDLAYLGDGWFACLFECGKEEETEQIALKMFNLNEMEGDAQESHTSTSQQPTKPIGSEIITCFA
ncbi:sialidase-2-like [Poecilia latipinna]|uniref:exo-alpha-sialidase n=1 Tax=Poecilia latipinna TaxID=48699 RepID=A0A3B3VUM9_9TELE|nr:PREDICTED: sialidase-2-like [Poecilia latipinna]